MFVSMKENLLRKSLTVDEQLSLQSERYSYLSTGRNTSVYFSTVRKPKKNPNKKIVETVRDESYELQMQNYGILRRIIKLYSHFPVLNPEGTAILIWNIVNFIIIIYYLFEIGLLIGFGEPFWSDEVTYFYAGNMVFVVFFIMDILISPLKAYYQNGILVTSRVSIFKRYYQLYLWLDLISLISIIAPYISLSLTTNYFKLIFCTKLLSAYELDKYLLMYVQNKFKRSHIYGLARLLLLILLWSHWFGIGFFALDYWIYTNNYYGPNTPNYCWIYNSPLNMNITQTNWPIQYLYSIYFSIGNISTIAYGDVVPRNPLQMIYIIFAMTFAILLFTYFFKEMIELIFQSQAEQIDNRQSFSIIKRFLLNNNVHKTLATKIKSYFQTNWQHHKLKNQEIQTELIEKLPKQLKIQLHIAYYGEFITQLGILPPNFINFTSVYSRSPFICQLSAAIQTEKVMAGQLLYAEAEPFQQHQCVYFVDKSQGELPVTLGVGRIDWPHAELFLDQHKTDQELYNLYGTNIVLSNIVGLFGQESFFLQNERSHWAISNRHMELIKLSKSKFMELMIKYAGNLEKQQICLAKENVQSRYCLICKEKGHMFSKCPYVSYIPDQNSLLDQLKLQNTRTNNMIITRHRESWVSFTTKQNSWKLYSQLKSARKKHLMQQEQRLEKEQQEHYEQINEHLFEELAILHTLVKQHINKQDQIQDKFGQSFNLDEGMSFSVYRPQCNIEQEVKRYNYYAYQRKIKKVKN